MCLAVPLPFPELSEIFWVSRQFIKKRLKIYVENNLAKKIKRKEEIEQKRKEKEKPKELNREIALW